MALEDRIQDTLVTDDETILESNLERVQPLFKLHQDGTINIENKFRKLGPRLEMLIYFIGQRFAYEGNLTEEDNLKTDFFYERFDKSNRTIRNYLQELREDGYITKEGQSEHSLVAENLPDALDWIEEKANQ